MKTPLSLYGQFAIIATIAESVLTGKNDGTPILEPKEALECICSLAKVGAYMATKEPTPSVEE